MALSRLVYSSLFFGVWLVEQSAQGLQSDLLKRRKSCYAQHNQFDNTRWQMTLSAVPSCTFVPVLWRLVGWRKCPRLTMRFTGTEEFLLCTISPQHRVTNDCRGFYIYIILVYVLWLDSLNKVSRRLKSCFNALLVQASTEHQIAYSHYALGVAFCCCTAVNPLICHQVHASPSASVHWSEGVATLAASLQCRHARCSQNFKRA